MKNEQIFIMLVHGANNPPINGSLIMRETANLLADSIDQSSLCGVEVLLELY